MGRSGSFIAYDIALKTLMRVGKVSLLDVVDKMRDDRVGLVQHYIQLSYINKCLRHYADDHGIEVTITGAKKKKKGSKKGSKKGKEDTPKTDEGD